MQLSLTFQADRIDLPINYRPLIHGMIYRALSEDAAFSSAVHNRAEDGRSFKGFTFSPLRGRYAAENGRIAFPEGARLEIRGMDGSVVARLYHRFMAEPDQALGGCPVRVERCELSDRHVADAAIRAECLSPVVVYTPGEGNAKDFASPGEDRFIELILSNAARKAQYYRLPVEFDLECALAEDAAPKRHVSSFKGSLIVGWMCAFELKGHPMILDMLYQTGLGAKNPAGYGMFGVSIKK